VGNIGSLAFESCTELRRVHFEGDLPTFGSSPFQSANQSFITYPGPLTTVAGRPAYDSRHIPVTTLSQVAGVLYLFPSRRPGDNATGSTSRRASMRSLPPGSRWVPKSSGRMPRFRSTIPRRQANPASSSAPWLSFSRWMARPGFSLAHVGAWEDTCAR
jgi:hypothetical protein